MKEKHKTYDKVSFFEPNQQYGGPVKSISNLSTERDTTEQFKRHVNCIWGYVRNIATDSEPNNATVRNSAVIFGEFGAVRYTAVQIIHVRYK